jgi:hypothetical protein
MKIKNDRGGRSPMSDFRLIPAGDLPVAPSKSSVFGTVVHARRNAPDDARKSDHGLKHVLTCNLQRLFLNRFNSNL